jgi:hypothetical protein
MSSYTGIIVILATNKKIINISNIVKLEVSKLNIQVILMLIITLLLKLIDTYS